MAKNLAQVLKADISRLPLRKAAEQLRKKGRHGDTMLAHITPKEAAKLKAEGGSGTINPDTGLPEFFDFDFTLGSTGDFQPSGSFSMPETFQAPPQADTSVFTPQEMAQNAASVQELYNADVGNQALTGVVPGQELWSNYFNTPLQTYQANLVNPPSTDVNLPAPPAMPADIAAARAQYLADASAGGDAYSTPPGIDKETMDRMAAAEAAKGKGIDTPFGKLGLKEAIAALGIGGMGLNYLNAQAQGKKAAQQLQAAYNQSAAQTRELAQPFMQQGGQQLGQALTGALSPAQQQQLAAAQAQAAQATASSGGVAAAQAGRSVEDLRQRLLANQQTMALQLLGSGTPLISQAIRDQLAGTTTGIQTNMQMSQQAGQAAGNMLAMLGAMYARG
jgi:hypothetical protein